MFIRTARLLEPLLSDLVFVGGSVIGLLTNDPERSSIRTTKDVDALVKAVSRKEYYEFDARIRTLGFSPDPDGPVCRYRKESLTVDLVPVDPKVLGFSNRWAGAAVEAALKLEIEPGLSVSIAGAPHILATKFEAFQDRGGGDAFVSHDIDDIIVLLDGRLEIESEIQSAPADLRVYLSGKFKMLIENDPSDLVQAHLDVGPLAGARALQVLARMRRIAAL